MSEAKSQGSARQRLIETADRLFYAKGFQAVGIDRIIAEASVAKMTLYNHFASKEELILEVLHYRDDRFFEGFDSRYDSAIEQGKGPMAALFASLRGWFETDTYRGCAFINASVELSDPGTAAFGYAADHKLRFRERLTEITWAEVDKQVDEQQLAKRPRPKQIEELTTAVLLLVEGAIVTSVIQQSTQAATDAERAAGLLMLGVLGS